MTFCWKNFSNASSINHSPYFSWDFENKHFGNTFLNINEEDISKDILYITIKDLLYLSLIWYLRISYFIFYILHFIPICLNPLAILFFIFPGKFSGFAFSSNLQSVKPRQGSHFIHHVHAQYIVHGKENVCMHRSGVRECSFRKILCTY